MQAASAGPAVPAANPVFATQLLATSVVDRRRLLPRGVPTLVVVGGPMADRYADVPATVDWAHRQRREERPVILLSCPAARHAVDNEVAPLGPAVRSVATDFVDQLIAGESPHPKGRSGVCQLA